MANVKNLIEKKAQIEAAIRLAKKQERRIEFSRKKRGEAHLKNALGGFCLQLLRDKDAATDIKQFLLSGSEDGITNDSENWARQEIERIKESMKETKKAWSNNDGDKSY